MKKLSLSEEDLRILNSNIGLKQLLADEKVDVAKALRMARYEIRIRELQTEMVVLQNWVIQQGKKVVILFEGRDAAGKGGAIRRITAHINPRHYKIVALPKPTEDEQRQWYFQRYVNRLPKPGEMVLFDRSWYNRAVVEPVNGFCTETDYQRFMGQVNEFERMILESGIFLIKFYFSISKTEQKWRFEDIKRSPTKKWKMSPVDERAQELWDQYTEYKQKMFAHTHTEQSPWHIIQADRKTEARVEVMERILQLIPYREADPSE